ncbi:MAG: hypothetical protein C5B46_04220 [Proteobacteria bacterium]|nr:MAG: hypothetical protein C5B46_04220 [Pseudomonadota bacterium]
MKQRLVVAFRCHIRARALETPPMPCVVSLRPSFAELRELFGLRPFFVAALRLRLLLKSTLGKLLIVTEPDIAAHSVLPSGGTRFLKLNMRNRTANVLPWTDGATATR